MKAERVYRPFPLAFERLAVDAQRARLIAFREQILTRRTVRYFSSDLVPDALIDQAIVIAGSAPSGANLQPWRFVVVRDPDVKRRIRRAAEEEERAFYEQRAPAEWLDALAPLGTDWHKEFLEMAPCLIVAFLVDYEVYRAAAGEEHRLKHYYANESIGIACGFLLVALHRGVDALSVRQVTRRALRFVRRSWTELIQSHEPGDRLNGRTRLLFGPCQQAIAVLSFLVQDEASSCLLEIGCAETERREIEPRAAKCVCQRRPFHLQEPQGGVGLYKPFLRRSIDEHVQMGGPSTTRCSRRISGEVTTCIPHHEWR